MIQARGGRVSDLFGALCHMGSPPSGSLKNALGVIASAPGMSDAHDRLCACAPCSPSPSRAHRRRGQRTVAEAVGVARCLDGAPLQLRWRRSALGGGGASAASVPGGAFRGMMSVGCRLQLRWKDDDDAGGARPRSAFYKRVVMGDLDGAGKALAAPLKLARGDRQLREAALSPPPPARARRRRRGAGGARRRPAAVGGRPGGVSLLAAARLLAGRRLGPAAAERRRGARAHRPRQAPALGDVLLAARRRRRPRSRPPSGRRDATGSRACNRTTSGARSPTSATPTWPSSARPLPRNSPASIWRPSVAGCSRSRAAARRRTLSIRRRARATSARERALQDDRPRRSEIGQPLPARDCRRRARGRHIDFQWLGFGLAATDVAHHVVGSIAADALAASRCSTSSTRRSARGWLRSARRPTPTPRRRG